MAGGSVTMSTPAAESGNYGSGESQRAFSGLPLSTPQSFGIDIAVTANNDAHIFVGTGGSPASGNGYEVLMLCVLCILIADSEFVNNLSRQPFESVSNLSLSAI